jgi:hypothetical protein
MNRLLYNHAVIKKEGPRVLEALLARLKPIYLKPAVTVTCLTLLINLKRMSRVNAGKISTIKWFRFITVLSKSH